MKKPNTDTLPSPAVRRVTRHLTFDATPMPVNTDFLSKRSDLPSKPSTIDVFLRIRPFSDDEKQKSHESCILKSTNDTVLKLRPKVAEKHPPGIRQTKRAMFKFSRIFQEDAAQEELFERTTLPLISHLFNGESAVVFAYGVTCSGKTFTIQGQPNKPGILPRALDVIINSIAKAKGKGLAQDSVVSEEVAKLTDEHFHQRRPRTRGKSRPKTEHDSNYIDVDRNVEYSIFASYLEIYNDMVFDLFDKSAVVPVVDDASSHLMDCNTSVSVAEDDGFSSDASEWRPICVRRPTLKLKERFNSDSGGKGFKEVYAEGQTEVRIKSVVDIERLLEFGCNNRTVAHTKSNTTSSRSHAVFEITLKQEMDTPGPLGRTKRLRTTSRLQIVDLAGSEKLTKASNSVNRAHESRQINTSLMNLSRCLEVMRRNQLQAQNPDRAHMKPRIVPFRDSKLTRLLQRGLSTGCAVMITTMSPSLEEADETIHTLRNTAIAREIKVKPSRANHVLIGMTNSNKDYMPRECEPDRKALGVLKNVTNTPRSQRANVIEKEVYLKETTHLKGQLRTVHEQLDVQLEEKNSLQQQVNTYKHIAQLSEDAVAEINDERDKLYRENERLREKLAHLEGKAQSLEYELRLEIGEQMSQAFAKIHERYENQIREMRKNNNSMSLNLEQGAAEVQSFKRRILRTSQAAFESMTREIQEDEEGDLELDGSNSVIAIENCDQLVDDLTVYEED